VNAEQAGIQFAVIRRVTAERERQDQKWGSQRHLPHDRWNTILGEEVGEVANAILEGDIANLKKELVQVAAVAIAFAEALEDGR
jgi:NTP pyrophosphatase (non-canonical NTP hydrolase)